MRLPSLPCAGANTLKIPSRTVFNDGTEKGMQALRAAREDRTLLQDLLWLASIARAALQKKTQSPPEVELVECFRQPRAVHEADIWQTEAEPHDTGWVIFPPPPKQLCERPEKLCAALP